MTGATLLWTHVGAARALRETLGRVRERNEFAYVRLETLAGPDWAAATDLLADDALMARLMARVGAANGTPRRDVIASIFFNGYCWPLVAFAVGAYLIDRRVPSLAVAEVMVRFDDSGYVAEAALRADRFTALGGDPAAGESGVTIAADLGALRLALRDELAASLAPMVDAVRARAPLGKRALWLAVADVCGRCIAHYGNGTGNFDLASREVAALAREMESPWRGKTGLVEVAWNGRSEAFVERASCCLTYKIPGEEYCAACPLTKPAERLRRLRAYMDEQS